MCDNHQYEVNLLAAIIPFETNVGFTVVSSFDPLVGVFRRAGSSVLPRRNAFNRPAGKIKPFTILACRRALRRHAGPRSAL
jgi:hypothetical protein